MKKEKLMYYNPSPLSSLLRSSSLPYIKKYDKKLDYSKKKIDLLFILSSPKRIAEFLNFTYEFSEEQYINFFYPVVFFSSETKKRFFELKDLTSEIVRPNIGEISLLIKKILQKEKSTEKIFDIVLLMAKNIFYVPEYYSARVYFQWIHTLFDKFVKLKMKSIVFFLSNYESQYNNGGYLFFNIYDKICFEKDNDVLKFLLTVIPLNPKLLKRTVNNCISNDNIEALKAIAENEITNESITEKVIEEAFYYGSYEIFIFLSEFYLKKKKNLGIIDAILNSNIEEENILNSSHIVEKCNFILNNFSSK